MRGSCHCGEIVFEVPTPPEWVGECNCSFCRRRGVLWAYYREADFQLLAGREVEGTYLWNSKLVQHHHCTVCACSTYSRSPTFGLNGPDFSQIRIGVNARLLEGLDLASLPRKPFDGASYPRSP